MAAVTIAKLKITPYAQKDAIAKIVYGDEWGITVRMPTPHQAGDTYAIGLDYENLLYPPGRPLCAGTDEYTVDGDNLAFSLKLGTARLRDWCSTLKKPTPIYVQIVRTRGETLETLMLDTLLALPSVFDGDVTVYPGDPIQDLLDEKLDKPEEEGRPGQYLALGPDGETTWKDGGGGGGGGGDTQADWDESDSDSPAYIQHKPTIPPPQVQADWDESDSESPAYIQHKPEIPAAQVQSDWDESDSDSPAYIRDKPEVYTRGETNTLLASKADLVGGTVPASQIPMATQDNLGGIKTRPAYGNQLSASGVLNLVRATDAEIGVRSQLYKPIVPNNLNTAVKAALTDTNHITLTSEQQATAKSVMGLGGAVRHVSSYAGLEDGDVFVWDANYFPDMVRNHIYRKEDSTIYTDLQAVGVTASTVASLSLSIADEVVDWSPAGDCTLASVALPAAGIVRSWELRLALASDATLTLGTGISFATDAEGTQDAVTGGAINILLVRATSAGATVYVCGTEASST